MQHNQTNTKQPVQNSKITEAFNDITDTLQEQDLTDFIQLQKTKADSANSWSVDIADFKTKKLCKKHVVVVTDIARASNLIHCLDDALTNWLYLVTQKQP